MLYVTTRNDQDVFTARHAMLKNCGPEGGAFVPLHSPVFSEQDYSELLCEKKDDLEIRSLAVVFSKLFATELSTGDVRLACGKRPIRICSLERKISAVQASSVHGASPANLARLMVQYMIRPDKVQQASQWAEIGVRISMLLAGYLVQRRDIHASEVDAAVVSGDFLGLMSAWYAREWGLPIGNIVCCCNENSGIWDLLMQGQLRTDAVAKQTMAPAADLTVPVGLERLVYACGGTEEVERYLAVCAMGGVYGPGENVLKEMKKGLSVSVVSEERLSLSLANRKTPDAISVYDALALAGIQDYRASTGATRDCMILKEM